jgi:histidine ammonia-lyase
LLFSALDFLTIGIHEIASISERRIERLVNPVLSGLPAFLVNKGGLHSGFMIAHVRDSATTPRLAARHHAFAIVVLDAAVAAWERPLHRLAGCLADAFLFLVFFFFFFFLFFFPPCQCTAAALVSENKTLCHPASVDSLSTSAAQEGAHTPTRSAHAHARLRTVRDQ